MKPCMMSGVYLQEPGATIAGMFEFTKELEIEGIDFCSTNLLPVPVKELRKMCNDYGIKAVCSTVVNDVNLPGMTEEKWFDNVKKIVEDACVLDTGKIMLPTPGRKGIPKEETRKKWLDRLGKATEIGKAAGIYVSIESYAADAFYSPFLSSGDLLLALKEAPELKITFDNGNQAVAEDPAEGFREIAPYVIHAHFKDWEILSGQEERSLLMPDGRYYRMSSLGEGIVDNISCVRVMKEYGYDGFINIEYFGAHDSHKVIRKSCEYLKRITI